MKRANSSSDTTSEVNVLLVDDRAENRQALRAVLSGPGYRIIEAASSSEALRALVAEDVAVILLDVLMSDMDGFELAQLIRARERTKLVPILFVTAQATDADFIARGYRVGAVDFLVKPLVPDIVRAKVGVFAQLHRQRAQIEASLREKEVLLREIHHRVKNNLQIITSLLHLQAARQSSDRVRALFTETNARVRSIALVHEQLHLSENLSAIQIEPYLRAVATGLMQSYGSPHTRLEIEAGPIMISVDAAVPCGLIVNELVSNALKYAFPDERAGSIRVLVTEDESDDLVIEVRDDGVGIADTIDLEHPTSMGFQLVRSLTLQLAGTLTLSRDGGTTVRIRFPKPEPLVVV